MRTRPGQNASRLIQNALQNMAELEAVSVIDEAFRRSTLPVPEVETPSPLGSDPWDQHVHHILKLAGVTIELVNQPAYRLEEGTPLHETVQIELKEGVDMFMENKELDKITFHGLKEIYGIQVKLNNAVGWKVTITDDIPKNRASTASAATRKRSATAEASKVIHSFHLYEVAIGGSEEGESAELRSTVAAAQIITINIAFKRDKEKDESIINADKFPEIYQRRVDVLFTNKHVITTQVCSAGLVLFYFPCKLRIGTQHLLCDAVRLLRRRRRDEGHAQLKFIP